MSYLFREVFLRPRVEVRCSLLAVTGMGNRRAHYVCAMLGVPWGVKLRDVDVFLFFILCTCIEANYLMEEDLRRVKVKTILKVKKAKSYRGLRHSARLPVRGQRTHSNARTRKKFSVV